MTFINAKIYTMSKNIVFENGFISFKNGLIEKVGPMSEYSPTDDEIEPTIDYSNTGTVITPGLIDAHCHAGMCEDGVGFEGDDGNEDTDPFTPHLRSIDAINLFDRSFEEALAAGITTVVSGPGSSNPIGGQMTALKTGGNLDDRIISSPLAMKMALGENPKITYHIKNQGPVTRMAIAAVIREGLKKAKRYTNDLKASKKDADIDEPEYDIKLDALAEVIKGLPIHIHAHRSDDILTALRLKDEFNLNMTIVHATDAHLITEAVARAKVPVLIGPLLTDRSKPEMKNLTAASAGILNKAKIKLAIVTDHPETPLKYLPICAALAVKEGLDYHEALKSITVNAAQICGFKNLGVLKAGYIADIAVFNGDPIDIQKKAIKVIIGGKEVYNV